MREREGETDLTDRQTDRETGRQIDREDTQFFQVSKGH